MARDIFKEIAAFDRRQLEQMRKNALVKGRVDIAAECDARLSQLPVGVGRRGAIKEVDIVEMRGAVAIAATALDENRQLRVPALLPMAEAIASQQSVSRVAVLKTQIRFYLRERHMIGGIGAKGQGYWIAVVNEEKLSDSTAKAWAQVGTVKHGKFYGSTALVVTVSELARIPETLEATQFLPGA